MSDWYQDGWFITYPVYVFCSASEGLTHIPVDDDGRGGKCTFLFTVELHAQQYLKAMQAGGQLVIFRLDDVTLLLNFLDHHERANTCQHVVLDPLILKSGKAASKTLIKIGTLTAALRSTLPKS